MKKNRKKMDINVMINKQMNCWDEIKRNFKVVSDNCESIGKNVKEIITKATMIKDFHEARTEKHNELIDNTHRKLSKSLNRLKTTKISITSIKENLNSSSSLSPTLRLPN